jgi:hypothetical protein
VFVERQRDSCQKVDPDIDWHNPGRVVRLRTTLTSRVNTGMATDRPEKLFGLWCRVTELPDGSLVGCSHINMDNKNVYRLQDNSDGT